MYVYKFVDNEDRVTYVGKTKDLNSRMNGHLNHGHLKSNIYETLNRVEFITCKTQSDMHILEMYYVNYYKPIGNRRDISLEDEITLEINHGLKWEVYNHETKEDIAAEVIENLAVCPNRVKSIEKGLKYTHDNKMTFLNVKDRKLIIDLISFRENGKIRRDINKLNTFLESIESNYRIEQFMTNRKQPNGKKQEV